MEENPMERLRYYRETGQAEEAKQYERYLRETGQWKDERSLPLARADVISALPRDRANPSGDFQALMAKGQGRVVADEVLPALAAHALNTAQGIPGMRALQSGFGAMGSKFTDSPMSYGEAQATLDEMTGGIPADLRIAEQVMGGSALTPFIGATASGAKRLAPVAKEAGKELIPRNVARAWKVARKARTAMKVPKVPVSPVRGAITPAAEKAPTTLEGLLGNSMENMAEAQRAATLEERLSLPDVVKATQRYRTESGRLQQGAPRARFEHFAEQMEKRAAAREAAAEPSLEDLLAASLEHIKKGGTLRQASDVAAKVRR